MIKNVGKGGKGKEGRVEPAARKPVIASSFSRKGRRVRGTTESRVGGNGIEKNKKKPKERKI